MTPNVTTVTVSPSEPLNGRWAALTLLIACHTVGATAQYGINTLAPFYQQELELSRTQIGLFFTAFYSGAAGFSFPAGWLADRLGVRATTLGGHVLLGLCTLAAALMPSFTSAIGSFFLAGLGYSFLNPASTKGVTSWFQRNERATAMGAKQTGVPAGGVLSAVVAAPLTWLVGWRVALATFGIINLFFGFLFFALWREPSCAAAVHVADGRSRNARGILDIRSLAAISFGTAVLLLAQTSLLTYVPLYLKEGTGLSSYWASQSLALIQIGAVIGRIGWGVVSDKLFAGRRKIILVFIGAASVIISLAMSFITPTTPLFVMLSGIFLAGLCMVGFQGVFYALTVELAGAAQTGTALGLVLTVNSLGAICGTPLFGYLVDTTGSYSFAWQALAGIVFVGTVGMAFFLKEPKLIYPG